MLRNSEQHKLGFAVGGGLKFNLPMLGHGDYVQGQSTYTKGALGYLSQDSLPRWRRGRLSIKTGAKTAVGDLYDAVGTNAAGSLT